MRLPAGYTRRAALPGDVDAILSLLHAGDVLDVGRPDTPTSPRDIDGVALLRARGGEHVRTFLHMQRSLEGLGPAGHAPAGVRLRGFTDHDWAVFHQVLETTLAEHFGFESLTLDTFVTMWSNAPNWDPGLVTFAEVDGGVVGVIVSSVTSTPGLGWVADVGVLAEHRGRGIAQTLLCRAFADLVERGCDTVRLNVDASNVTGAVRLYEKVGMQVRREWAVYEQTLTRG